MPTWLLSVSLRLSGQLVPGIFRISWYTYICTGISGLLFKHEIPLRSPDSVFITRRYTNADIHRARTRKSRENQHPSRADREKSCHITSDPRARSKQQIDHIPRSNQTSVRQKTRSMPSYEAYFTVGLLQEKREERESPSAYQKRSYLQMGQ